MLSDEGKSSEGAGLGLGKGGGQPVDCWLLDPADTEDNPKCAHCWDWDWDGTAAGCWGYVTMRAGADWDWSCSWL